MVDTCTRVWRATATACIAMSLAACTGGVPGDASSGATSSPQYTVGGTVSGLSGSGLVLATNTGETLAVGASGSFTFKTSYPSGSPYYVLVLSQPSTPTQTCLASNGTGTIGNANVTSIAIACQDKTTPTDAIGGMVVGLTGTGLILQNNGSDTLSVAANGAFVFSHALPSGSPYNISVLSPPINPYEDCEVLNGQGTTTDSDIANIGIVCTVNSSPTYTIGGTVSGISGTLVLQDNGRDDLTITADGTFKFPIAIPSGSSYEVTTKSAAGGQSQACVFTNATGTVGDSDITNITISCNANVTLRAVVSGLAGTGLTLQNTSNGDNLAVTANGTVPFATGLPPGDPYNVTVTGQPTNPSQTCVVANGAGTAASGSTVPVTCTTNTYTLGGTISGLPDPATSSSDPGANLVLQDNLGDTFTTAATATSPIPFTFATPIPSGSAYSVSVQSQPGLDTTGGTPGVIQTSTVCVVTPGTDAGTVNSSNITNVVVNCVRPLGFAYVTNSGDNTISTYVIDSASGALLPYGTASTGNAPSSATMDGNGHLYVSNSGSSNLSGYTVDPNAGGLTPLSGSPFVITGLNAPTSVATSYPASYPWLYVSNPAVSGPGSISAATISASGTPTDLTGSPLGTQVGPTGGVFFTGLNSYYLETNSSSNTLSAYLVDTTTGAISSLPGSPIATGTAPVSVTGLQIFLGTESADFAYVANSGDGTISDYGLDNQSVFSLQSAIAEAGLTSVTVSGALTCGCYVYASGPSGIWGFSTDQNGALTPLANGAYPAGAGAGAIATMAGQYVYRVNTTDQTVSVFQIGATGALTPVAGTAVKTGQAPSSILVVSRPIPFGAQ